MIDHWTPSLRNALYICVGMMHHAWRIYTYVHSRTSQALTTYGTFESPPGLVHPHFVLENIYKLPTNSHKLKLKTEEAN